MLGLVRWASTTPNAPQESHHYYRDSFTLLSHDADGVPILMDMEFNRKELKEDFVHYYSGKLWYGDAVQSFSTQFHSKQPEIQAHKYLANYQVEPSADLSTRASHTVTVTSDFGELSFTTPIEGDFLTKNTLDYTRFSSATETTLSMSGEEFSAQILWGSAYSSDYTKSIFFEGRDELESETHLFTLWDEDGNFYHIDQSKVVSDHPDYVSHTWLLYKNASDQSTKKSFEAEIVISQTGVDVELPEWSTTVHLDLPQDWNAKNHRGYVQGSVERADGTTKTVEGYFEHAFY